MIMKWFFFLVIEINWNTNLNPVEIKDKRERQRETEVGKRKDETTWLMRMTKLSPTCDCHLCFSITWIYQSHVSPPARISSLCTNRRNLNITWMISVLDPINLGDLASFPLITATICACQGAYSGFLFSGIIASTLKHRFINHMNKVHFDSMFNQLTLPGIPWNLRK